MSEERLQIDRHVALRGLTVLGLLVLGLVGTVGYRVVDAAARRQEQDSRQLPPLATTAPVQPAAEPIFPAFEQTAAAPDEGRPPTESNFDEQVDQVRYTGDEASTPQAENVVERPRFVAPGVAADEE